MGTQPIVPQHGCNCATVKIDACSNAESIWSKGRSTPPPCPPTHARIVDSILTLHPFSSGAVWAPLGNQNTAIQSWFFSLKIKPNTKAPVFKQFWKDHLENKTHIALLIRKPSPSGDEPCIKGRVHMAEIPEIHSWHWPDLNPGHERCTSPVLTYRTIMHLSTGCYCTFYSVS